MWSASMKKSENEKKNEIYIVYIAKDPNKTR